MPDITIVKVPGGYLVNGILMADGLNSPEGREVVRAASKKLADAIDAKIADEVYEAVKKPRG